MEPADPGESATSDSVARGKDRRDAWGAALLSMDAEQLLRVAGRICNIVFSCDSWEDDSKGLN